MEWKEEQRQQDEDEENSSLLTADEWDRADERQKQRKLSLIHI